MTIAMSSGVGTSMSTPFIGQTLGIVSTTATANMFLTVIPPSVEVVHFGFGITLWRDKKTGYVRHPPKGTQIRFAS